MDPTNLRKKILVVEGVELFRHTMVQWLRGAGYEVFSISDGGQEYEAVQKFIPDMLVVDAMSPKLDVALFLKKIKALPLGAAIKVLVMNGREKVRETFDLLGVNGVLSKEVQEQEFLTEVERIFQEEPEWKEQVYKRVLIVGRYEECASQMREQLEKDGCHTDFVLFGEQVISKAVLFLPNVVIMESRMIDMGSRSIIHILRQMPQFRKIPILIFNYFDPSEVKKTSAPHEDLAMSLYVRGCLDEGATESVGRFPSDSFWERVNKYVKKGTVVAIDDDEATVRLLKNGLENRGYQVLAASNANSGLDLVRRTHPSVILLDIVMPGTDGIQLLGLLKSDPSLKSIPVIMLSVQDSDIEIQRVLDLGADDYMVKPFHLNLFLKRLEVILEANR